MNATSSIGLGPTLRLSALRLRRSRKLWLAVALVVASLLAFLVTRYGSAVALPIDMVQKSIGSFFFGFLVFVLPLVFHAALISDEVDQKTLPYRTSRPTGRIPMMLGKYIANTILVWALLTAGLLILHFGAFATLPTALVEQFGFTLRALATLLLLSATYGALCAAFGALFPRASWLLSIVYFLVVEAGLGLFPGGLRSLSLNYHARALANAPTANHARFADPDTAISIAVIFGAWLLFASVALIVVHNTEYRTGATGE